MPTPMNLPTLVAEAVLAELARNPERYRSVTPGPKGDSVTIDLVRVEADHSLTLEFSDGTTFNTPPIRGDRGPKGVQGEPGPRGVSVHHTRWTATTNPEHHFGVAGHMDTYTLYGDEDELSVLGWFSVKNGEDGKDSYDYAVEGGYEGTKEEFYKDIAENATNIEQIRNLVSQIEHLFDMVENKGQEFIDQINQIIADFLAMKGAPDGFAELDENGKVPVEQIPDEVRGIIRVNTHAELPISGVPRQLYLVVQDETAEGASTLYHWAEFEYRPATSSTTVLGLTELRGLIAALDDDKASRQELNDARTELEADTLAVKQDLEALTELVGVLGDFRELAFVAHRMHLPVEGEDEVLYIVRSDETNFGDLSIYAWTIDGYQRVSGKIQEAIDQRITALVEATDTDRELFLQRLQELADEVASTYATKDELTDASQALDERLTLLEEKDEVIEVNTRYDLPATGKHGVIYVVRHDSLSNHKATIHIWNGEDYSPIVSPCNTALGEVSSSASEVLATQVWNTSTNDIAAGTPVMLAGHTINEQPAVVPLDLNDPEVLSKFVGIVYKTVSAGKSGVAVRGGVVRNFNTLGGDENWQNGDALYFRGNGSGVISNTIPSIGNYNKPVGYVLEAADNKGILYLVQDPVGNILGGDGGDGNGAPGKSAYEIAVEVGGFAGTKAEWLQSLVGPEGPSGKSAYESAVEGGYTGTEDEWALAANGKDGEDGKSNYELAVEDGYTGTLSEWLETVKGEPGADGKSAYKLAIESGVFVGTLEEWLTSLKGADGKSAYETAVEEGFTGSVQDWLGTAVKGADGKSAYEIAQDGGFVGTEQEWLDSLKGEQGPAGKSAYETAVDNGFIGTLAEWLESLKADNAALDELSIIVPQAEAEAGTATTKRAWTAQRVAQAVAALGLKIGTTAGTVAAGDDSRIVNALQPDRIVQGLGTDSTKVMSQAAVTAALSGQQASTDTYQGWYGTVWNTVTDSYIRIGSRGFTSIQSQMRRCVLNTDGTVRYFLHPTNSTFKEDGSVAVIDGSEGNVMVQIPKFYCQVTDDGVLKTIKVSLDPADGFPVHPAFVKAGVEVPFRYYRAYTATVVAGKLISRSGATPTRNTTLPNFRIAARANGAGWELVDWYLHNAVCKLIFTEFCDMRTDLYIGRGNDVGNDYGILTGQSNLIGNGSSPSTNHNMWMSYRGIENFYADCWECIDGINFQDRQAYICGDHTQFASDVFSGAYEAKGPVWVSGSGTYVRDYRFSEHGFFPTATADGGSAVAAGDGLWNSEGTRVLYTGGSAKHGALAGALCFIANSAASASNANRGAGVSF